jgi:hypothetical protein
LILVYFVTQTQQAPESNPTANYNISSNLEAFLQVFDEVHNRPTTQQKLKAPIRNLCFPSSTNPSEELCIPSVICPGVQKSGTSFIWNSLRKHPRIGKAFAKEVDFYIKGTYERGIEYYATHFESDPGNKLLVDFSPKYLMIPESPRLIYNTNRSAKFIFLLRNPVTRAYSHFQYQADLYTRHQNDIPNMPCVDRVARVTFKEYLGEEWNVLHQCNQLHWNTQAVSKKNFTYWTKC